jgi:hypothetical protein
MCYFHKSLITDYKQRPGPEELINHPFVSQSYLEKNEIYNLAAMRLVIEELEKTVKK